jgi:translation initiation factor 2D
LAKTGLLLQVYFITFRANTEIDNAFKAAAMFGLYQIVASDAQTTISFPLPSSTWVSSHLNPYLPDLFTQYNFRKTSWKKAATFLKKYLEKEGLIRTKDRGGETVILSIKWDHKLITEFEPYQLAKEPQKGQGKEDQHSAPFVHTIQVKELFKPSGKALKAILDSQSKSLALTNHY